LGTVNNNVDTRKKNRGPLIGHLDSQSRTDRHSSLLDRAPSKGHPLTDRAPSDRQGKYGTSTDDSAEERPV